MRCYKCGTIVEGSSKFCTSCGSNLYSEDAVVRILEDETAGNNYSAMDSVNQDNTVLAATKGRGSKMKILAAVSVLLSGIVIFTGIYLFGVFNKEDYRYDGEFVLMVKEKAGKRDLYLGIPGKKEVKLESDVAETYYYNYVRTGSNSRLYLYVNAKEQLYEADGKGDKEKIGNGVRRSYIAMSPDLKKYLFTSGDKDTLYLKEKGKDKVKIENEVQNYFFLEDNETIIFLNEDEELFMRKKNGEIEELADDVLYPYATGGSTGIAYTKNDDATYLYNIKTGEEKKLTNLSGEKVSYFDKAGNLYYINDGDLYLLKDGKQSIKIDKDVVDFSQFQDGITYVNTDEEWFVVESGSTKAVTLPDIGATQYMNYSKGYIYYTDENQTLFRTKVGNDEIDEIHEKVVSVYTLEDNVYFTAEVDGQTLYKLEGDGSVKEVQEEVRLVYYVDNSYLAYITEDEVLYVDGKEYKDVAAIAVAGKNICYVNSDDELYLIEGKSSPKLISEDIREYSQIYFGDSLLFEIGQYLNNQKVVE
jgi:hypothetical protein